MSCMKRFALIPALLVLIPIGGSAGAKTPKLYIKWAESWEDAVTEARALNMPIVVHRHGFY